MPEPENLEDRIEKLVEEKVESAVEDRLDDTREEVEESVKQDIKSDLLVDATEFEEDNSGVDRRRFLKMLGLGAGGLALASPASSFIPLASSSGGGSQTLSDVLSEGNDINSHDIVDGGTTVWDTSAGSVRQAQLGGPASSLSGYPLSLASDTDLDVSGSDLTDGATVIWDASNSHIPEARIQQGSGSGLDADMVDGKHASEL